MSKSMLLLPLYAFLLTLNFNWFACIIALEYNDRITNELIILFHSTVLIKSFFSFIILIFVITIINIFIFISIIVIVIIIITININKSLLSLITSYY